MADILIDGIAKSFGHTVALERIDLSIADGCSVGIARVADSPNARLLRAREAFATQFPRRRVIRKGKLIAETRLETYRYFDLPAAPGHKD